MKKILNSRQKLLEINPEFYTIWNFRREILQHLFQFNEPQEKWKPSALQKELGFTEKAIASHPKSYWAWNHRVWITEVLGESCDWNQEIRLCHQMLEFDSRNFHCWKYRSYVVQKGKISPKEEFVFTKNKIEQNFSNYSAWHRRSVIFPQVSGYDSEQLIKEFEFVVQALFTDPADQSAWFYHRWLRSKISSDTSQQVLEQELSTCNELLEIEPESKWALLTKVFILRELKNEQDQIDAILQQLQQLDPNRKAFYQDLHSAHL